VLFIKQGPEINGNKVQVKRTLITQGNGIEKETGKDRVQHKPVIVLSHL